MSNMRSDMSNGASMSDMRTSMRTMSTIYAERMREWRSKGWSKGW